MTRIVAFLGTDQINQFYRLPSRFNFDGEEYRIFHIDSLEKNMEVTEQGVNSAFDLVIEPTYQNLSNPDIDPAIKTVYLNRYDKVNQQRLLTDFINNSSNKLTKEYLNLGAIPIDLKNMRIGEFNGKGVLKSVDGTNSIGIMKFDTNKTNLRSFLTQFKKTLADEKNTNEDVVKLCKEFDVEINIGNESYPNEMITGFRVSEFMIQHENPFDDVVELRLLKTASNLNVFKRDHFYTDNLNIVDTQFSLAGESIEDQPFSQMMLDAIELVSSRDFPLLHGSIDLWYSKKGMRWGIYEYQNQYAHVFIPETFHAEFLKETVHLLYNEFDAIET